MIIATVVPNDYFAPWDFVSSFLNISKDYPIKTVQSCSIAHNRNLIFQETKGDLLFIDSDTIFTPEDVAIIERDLKTYDIVGGAVVLANGELNIYKRIEGDYEYMPMQRGIFEVGAIGTGFIGISEKVISEMHEPFFPLTEGKITHGADISFCHRAREKGFKIYCDSEIKVGHIKTRILTHEDARNYNPNL